MVSWFSGVHSRAYHRVSQKSTGGPFLVCGPPRAAASGGPLGDLWVPLLAATTHNNVTGTGTDRGYLCLHSSSDPRVNCFQAQRPRVFPTFQARWPSSLAKAHQPSRPSVRDSGRGTGVVGAVRPEPKNTLHTGKKSHSLVTKPYLTETASVHASTTWNPSCAGSNTWRGTGGYPMCCHTTSGYMIKRQNGSSVTQLSVLSITKHTMRRSIGSRPYDRTT